MTLTRSLLILVPMLSAACGGPSPEAARADTPTPVTTARVQQSAWPSTFEAGGRVRARTSAAIASRLLAPVMTVHVRAGDRVRRGAPLVTLEARQLTAARVRAEAGAGGSEQDVRSADSAVRAATAALTLAQATHDRIQGLHEKRSATTHELDEATARLDEAAAQLESARARSSAAMTARAAAHAGVEAASAAVSDATLVAPFDGVITERRVDPGDMAVPGVPLLTLEDTGAFRVEVTLDEARAAFVSRSQPARVALGDAIDAPWTDAIVTELARVHPASHGFVVTLDLPAGAHASSGTFARARFDGPARSGLLIPATAAVRRGQLTFVYLVDEQHQARLQPISPGARVGDRLEVLAGLSANALVVLAPPASLADAAPIREEAR